MTLRFVVILLILLMLIWLIGALCSVTGCGMETLVIELLGSSVGALMVPRWVKAFGGGSVSGRGFPNWVRDSLCRAVPGLQRRRRARTTVLSVVATRSAEAILNVNMHRAKTSLVSFRRPLLAMEPVLLSELIGRLWAFRFRTLISSILKLRLKRTVGVCRPPIALTNELEELMLIITSMNRNSTTTVLAQMTIRITFRNGVDRSMQRTVKPTTATVRNNVSRMVPCENSTFTVFSMVSVL